jgi:hypothetical protein
MNATDGGADFDTAFTLSSVGPHCAVWQNDGVANTSTNGSAAASASATARW